MLNKRSALELVQLAVEEASRQGFESEVYWNSCAQQTTRSAHGEITQAPTSHRSELSLRLRHGKRFTEVVVGDPTLMHLRQAIARAGKDVQLMRSCSSLPPMVAQPARLPEEEMGIQRIPGGFFRDLSIKEETFGFLRRVNSKRCENSGRFSTFAFELAIANSKGVARYYATHYALFSVVLHGSRKLTSYAARCAKLPKNLDYRAAYDEAYTRVRLMDSLPLLDPLAGRNSRRSMPVILDRYAVKTLLHEINDVTFRGYNIDVGESFLSGRKTGQRVTGRKVTLREDWRDSFIPAPFDFEGRTRQHFPLLEKGVYRNVPYDGMAAKMMGTRPTGHSLLALGSGVPTSVIMEGGDASLENLIERSERSTVLITYFHYPAMDYHREAIFSAVSMHGVMMVRSGKVIGAVARPLRTRIEFFPAMESLDGLTESLPLCNDEHYDIPLPISYRVPAMRLGSSVAFLNDGRAA